MPLYFICADGGALSFVAAKAERRNILHAIAYPEYGDKQWEVVGCEINWEDADLICDHTGERIESAYAEDRAEV